MESLGLCLEPEILLMLFYILLKFRFSETPPIFQILMDFREFMAI